MADASGMTAIDASAPIGIFDSGVGGVSILRELERALPMEKYVYFADTLHVPYGPRTLAEVRTFSERISANLIGLSCKLIVIACNTASGAALRHLRRVFPGMRFVGMEPAVKPAAEHSRTRKVGVLATRATLRGELFAYVVERWARDAEILCQPCPGLAELIETHAPDHPDIRPMLERFILPLRDAGVDQLVLACTHYPLVRKAIEDVAGEGMEVVDPSPAIARRTRQVLLEANALANGMGGTRFLASGDPEAFSRSAALLLGRRVEAEAALFSV